MTPYRIKVAETSSERAQIHALNYATFVEEIPQHSANTARSLVDRFDAENDYVIAVDSGGTVAGMLALRARRPFSLDEKLPALDDHLPPHRSACEVRLLSVRREFRHGRIFSELIEFAARRCIAAGHDLALISGTTRQLDLYRHLGFEPFGPLVGQPHASFQPMYLALESFLAHAGRSLGITDAAESRREGAASFLPGPVAPHPETRAAFVAPAVSHRRAEFVERVRRVRARLSALTGAADAALLVGTGTLANDVVACRLAALGGRGIVFANGEFGERLADHALRMGLKFDVHRREWGQPYRPREIEDAVRDARPAWIWAVHCETSTGVLNDLEPLKRVAAACGAVLCLDCISSIGSVPVDLRGVQLATCASGKALGAYAGLASVFVGAPTVRGRPSTLPRYLDLDYWLARDSVPFTHSSNLVAALDAALAQAAGSARMQRTARDARWLRQALRARGMRVVAPEASASPAVTTIALPAERLSLEIGEALEHHGYEISCRSAYLVERNWIQIALMGEYDCRALRELPEALAETCGGYTCARRARPSGEL